MFAVAAVLAPDHMDTHRGISAALQKAAALAEVALKNHVAPVCLASLSFLLQCLPLRHFQLLP